MFLIDWIFPSEMIEIINNIVFSNDDIDFDYMDTDIVTFFSDGVDITINALMILILMIILKLLFMLDLWLRVMNINEEKHLKKSIQQDGKIDACQKMRKK